MKISTSNYVPYLAMSRTGGISQLLRSAELFEAVTNVELFKEEKGLKSPFDTSKFDKATLRLMSMLLVTCPLEDGD